MIPSKCLLDSKIILSILILSCLGIVIFTSCDAVNSISLFSTDTPTNTTTPTITLTTSITPTPSSTPTATKWPTKTPTKYIDHVISLENVNHFRYLGKAESSKLLELKFDEYGTRVVIDQDNFVGYSGEEEIYSIPVDYGTTFTHEGYLIQTLSSGFATKIIEVIDLRTGKTIHTLKDLEMPTEETDSGNKYSNPPSGYAISEDGSKLAILWNQNQLIKIWDFNSSKSLEITEYLPGYFYDDRVSFSPDGNYLSIIGEWWGPNLVYSLEREKMIVREKDLINGARFSPIDNEIVMWGKNSFTTFNLKTGVTSLNYGVSLPITTILYSDDGKYLIIVDYDEETQSVRKEIRNKENGKLIAAMLPEDISTRVFELSKLEKTNPSIWERVYDSGESVHYDLDMSSLDIINCRKSDDTEVFLYVEPYISMDEQVLTGYHVGEYLDQWTYDLSAANCSYVEGEYTTFETVYSPPEGQQLLDYSDDGKLVLLLDVANRMSIIQRESGEVLARLGGFSKHITNGVISSHGNYVIAYYGSQSMNDRSEIRLFHVDFETQKHSFTSLLEPWWMIERVEFSPDENHFAILGSGVLNLYHSQGYELPIDFDHGENFVFSHNSDLFITYKGYGDLQIIDLTEERFKKSIPMGYESGDLINHLNPRLSINTDGTMIFANSSPIQFFGVRESIRPNISPTPVNTPTSNTPKKTNIPGTPTAIVEKTNTKTNSKTATPTPMQLLDWPELQYMTEDYTITRPIAEYQIVSALNIYIFDPDTTILLDYEAGKLTGPLKKLIEQIFPEGFRFTICGDSSSSVSFCWRTPPDIDLRNGSLSEYFYDKATAVEICQFLESATLEGYGYGAYQSLDEVLSLQYLMEEFGKESYKTNETRFYCSNFDPDSEDFLSIAKLLGYWDLISEIE